MEKCNVLRSIPLCTVVTHAHAYNSLISGDCGSIVSPICSLIHIHENLGNNEITVSFSMYGFASQRHLCHQKWAYIRLLLSTSKRTYQNHQVLTISMMQTGWNKLCERHIYYSVAVKQLILVIFISSWHIKSLAVPLVHYPKVVHHQKPQCHILSLNYGASFQPLIKTVYLKGTLFPIIDFRCLWCSYLS